MGKSYFHASSEDQLFYITKDDTKWFFKQRVYDHPKKFYIPSSSKYSAIVMGRRGVFEMPAARLLATKIMWSNSHKFITMLQASEAIVQCVFFNKF